jgi:phage shock protein PspC (stress-responsive transcriptional regulator)
MKKVIDITIGKVVFTMEDDAYARLEAYLKSFEESLPDNKERVEVMEDIELRIAELFEKESKFPRQVIDLKIVESVIACLGEVENDKSQKTNNNSSQSNTYYNMKTSKKLYRNPDDKKIAGVCSGIAAYFDIDPTIIRLIFILLVISGGSGILVYIILWVVMEEANTVAKKLEMRGEPVTAENIRNYTDNNRN